MVSEQTRRLIRGGCYGDSGGKWMRDTDVDGNIAPKLLKARFQDARHVSDWCHKMFKNITKHYFIEGNKYFLHQY